LVGSITRTLDQKWPFLAIKIVSSKIDTQQSNEHTASSWTARKHSKLCKIVVQKLCLINVRIFKDYSSSQFLRLKFSHTKTLQPIPRAGEGFRFYTLDLFWDLYVFQTKDSNIVLNFSPGDISSGQIWWRLMKFEWNLRNFTYF
jgi:hypothetical protein